MSRMMASPDESASFRTPLPRCPYRSEIATPTVVAHLEVIQASVRHRLSETLSLGLEVLTIDSRTHSAFFERGPPA
jgi:hypothetical protein